jgi:hypothetical protein
MLKSKKTVAVAAIAAAVMFSGSAYAAGVHKSDRTHVSKKQAHAQQVNPFGWPGAAVAGAGHAAGSIVGGTLGATGAFVGAPFNSYAYQRNGYDAFASGRYGAYPEYNSFNRDCLGDYDSAGVRCR